MITFVLLSLQLEYNYGVWRIFAVWLASGAPLRGWSSVNAPA